MSHAEPDPLLASKLSLYAATGVTNLLCQLHAAGAVPAAMLENQALLADALAALPNGNSSASAAVLQGHAQSLRRAIMANDR